MRYKDYQIDYENGVIKFNKAYQQFFVYYKYLPLKIPLVYQDWKMERESPTFRKTEEKKVSKSPISLMGTKSFSINADTRGISFDQATDIRISGQVQGLKISGVLSDENLPNEGVSLKEVNKVYVKAEGKNISIKIGDIDMPYLNRKKDVIGGGISYGNSNVSFGLNRGIFYRNEFYGEEDIQGPYILRGKNGERVSIIENSEKVYLNGKMMKMGSEQDYTMDYENGEITFTPKHPISSDDKITVEFEYLIGQWRRYTFSGNIEKNGMGISVLQEEDIYNDSLIENIVQTTDSQYVWIDNGHYVGYNKGDYVKSGSIYVFKGYHRGDYEVDFRYEGESKGDYVYDYTLGGFRYVGIGNGKYTAKRKFTLPSLKRGIGFNINKGYSFFHIIASGRMLSTKRYVIPMNKNGGFFRLSPVFNLGNIFTFGTNIYYRYADYQTFGDECGNQLLTKYDFFGVPDKVIEGKAGLNYKTLQISVEDGRLLSGDTLLDRISSTISLFPFSVSYQLVNGTFTSEKGNITMGNPQYNIYGEYTALNRIGKRKGGVYLKNRWGSLNIFSGWEFGEGGDTATVQGGNIQYQIKSEYINLLYKRRIPLKTGNRQTILSLSNGTEFSFSHLSIRATTDISRKSSSLWEEVYDEVSPGEGDYSYDTLTNTYYRDPYGNYIRSVYQTDEKTYLYEIISNASIKTYQFPIKLSFNGFLNLRGNLYTKKNINGIVEYPEKKSTSVFIRFNLRDIQDKMGYNMGYDYYRQKTQIGIKWKENPYREFGLLLKNQEGYTGKGIFWTLKNSGRINGGLDGKVLRNIKELVIYNLTINPYLRFSFNQKLFLNFNLELVYNRYSEGIPEAQTKYLYPQGITYTTYPSVDYNLSEKIGLHIAGYYRIIPDRENQYNARMEIESKF